MSALWAARKREPLDGLGAYATEKENPGNTKRVARLEVALPASRLRPGVTLVDTPGLGSLATASAAETRAYLPRCDLGVVLVDAGSTLTPEDVALVQALLAAGARTEVLLSKADLVAAADRDEATDYVRRQLRAQLGVELAVHPVSVVGREAALAEAWFEGDLGSLLAKHCELAAASLVTKTEALRAAVARSLRDRLVADGPGEGSGAPAASADVLHRRVLRRLDEARWSVEDLAREIAADQGAMVAEAAAEIARR